MPFPHRPDASGVVEWEGGPACDADAACDAPVDGETACDAPVDGETAGDAPVDIDADGDGETATEFPCAEDDGDADGDGATQPTCVTRLLSFSATHNVPELGS